MKKVLLFLSFLFLSLTLASCNESKKHTVTYTDANGQEVINFGKYKGRPVEDVLKTDKGYYGWILQSDFPLSTKRIFTSIMLRMKK